MSLDKFEICRIFGLDDFKNGGCRSSKAFINTINFLEWFLDFYFTKF